jgi:site-specific recombinase
MRLLAARVSGLGVQPEVRDRGTAVSVSDSPFYQLIAITEELLRAVESGEATSVSLRWREAVQRCRWEMAQVHLHMESAGVSVELIFDLKKIEQSLSRMEAIVAVLVGTSVNDQVSAVQALLGQVIEGRLSDRSLRSLMRGNLNLIARKMVERTGHSGEHYIAHDRPEYWHMWRAAIGGGLFTVFTAAIKMRIVDAHLPPFAEGFLSGTNYAISFMLLQVMGLVLATKQPAATAAAFAGIIRNNKGEERSSKISQFVARITSTQLAAAIGNVIAVSVGAVIFEKIWSMWYAEPYLGQESAQHVYETLHPFASGTAFYAIVTGVILWMAALAGGWFENLAVYYRFADAVAQHPMGTRVGESPMRKLSRVLERNLGGWSTSIVLGYLLGFTPVMGHFFGVPLDVRHVTLSTGTLALAAARFGFESLGRTWFYHALEGIAVIFVLNLTVSFAISAFVALRAYDVRPAEQWRILGFVCREIVKSPLQFIWPKYSHPSSESEPQVDSEKLQQT